MGKFRFFSGIFLTAVTLFSASTAATLSAAASQLAGGSSVATKTYTDTPNDLTYPIHFGSPRVRATQLYGEDFTAVEVPGAFPASEKAGFPLMQVAPIRLLIPQGTEVTDVNVTAENTVQIDLGDFPLEPSQPEVPFGHARPVEISMNSAAYSSSTPYPVNLFKNLGVSSCRGYSILTLNVYPTQYIPQQGKLLHHTDMTIHVNLKHTGQISRFYRPNNQEDRDWVRSLVMNAWVVESYKELVQWYYPGGLCHRSDNGGKGYDYVIITRAALLNFTADYNWDDLIAQKEAQGLEATKISVEDILACPDYQNPDPLFNDTPARIREFCRDAYQDWGLKYVLVAGDQDGANAVQRRLMDYSYESNCESDLYWSNLDGTFNDDHDSDWGEEGDTGFDLYSELWFGSIPCDTGTDISNWLTKSFYYNDSVVRDYLENAAFYGGDTGWETEGDDFVDYSAITGYDYWPGPEPEPYPDWLWFQYGFATWNDEMPGLEYDLDVKWTAEPTNPGWQGGSQSAAITGLRTAINNNACTLISGIAHANSSMSLDVYDTEWESQYHNTEPFFLTDYGCHCGDMDAEDDGVLHSMLFHSNTELAFGVTYNTGYGWGEFLSTKSSSALQQKSFWDYFFNPDISGSTLNWQLGKAHAWSKDLMAPTIDWGEYGSWRGIIETCLLFADPALLIKPPVMPVHNVGVQSLDVASHVEPGTSVTVGTTIINNGENDEADVIVSFLVDSVTVDSQIIEFFQSQTLVDLVFEWIPEDVAVYDLMISVEIPGVIEDFYFDNQKSASVISGPDIAVTELHCPHYAAVGRLTEIGGHIENPGTSGQMVDVFFKIDDVPADSVSMYLESGASYDVNFDWYPGSEGTFNISISAEIEDEEPYVENNQMSDDVEVFVSNGYVLLVDDDEGDSYETYFEGALLSAGYLYDVWDRSNQGSPSADVMDDYDAVVWFTGDDYYTTLESNDTSNLSSYLNGGGRLFLTGQDIGYDIGGTSFYTNYLHASYLTDNTDIHTLDGTSGETIYISGGDGADNQNWPSGINPISPADYILTYQGSSLRGGILVDTGIYRVIYYAFGFEAINNQADRTEVISRVLGWLN